MLKTWTTLEIYFLLNFSIHMMCFRYIYLYIMLLAILDTFKVD